MITEAEKGIFFEICQYALNQVFQNSGIGTYKEKMVHLVLKKFFCEDESCHEVKTGRFIADACTEDRIFEIQTGGFYPLKKKISSYIEDTDKKITVVCPMNAKRRMIWVDAENGEMSEPRRVTPGRPKNKFLRELIWIAPIIDFSRVEFKLVYLDVDEYKLLDGFGADKKTKATKIDRIPRELVDIVTLDSRESLADFLLPQNLPAEFRAKDFERATGLRKKGVSAGLRALQMLGIIEREKQGGRAVIYRIVT